MTMPSEPDGSAADTERPRVLVAGHRGMVGAALVRALQARDDCELLCPDRTTLDLSDQAAVRTYFEQERVDQVYLAAAKVGGIRANDSYPAQFIRENLAVQANVIHEAWRAGVHRLLFLGSSCIYPRDAPQPMSESALLAGTLEPTNRPYAVAKIAGIEMCDAYNRQYGTDFRCAMPTNLYGPGDNFDLADSHVVPALLRKFHEAAENGAGSVDVWGSGRPRREFLHVDDLARACLFLMALPASIWRDLDTPHVNVGTGTDVSIAELASMVATVTGFGGDIEYDPAQPDGTPRKLLDVQLIQRLGWAPDIGFQDGLYDTYAWYLAHRGEARGVAVS